MRALEKRLRILEDRARRDDDSDVGLVVMRVEDITEAQRRVSERTGLPIIVVDR